jgi:hypothetical protein
MKSKLVAAMSAAFVVVLASPASAGGFLAETFVKPFSPSLARKLDKEHAKLGNPLEHFANITAGAAADSLLPGSGPAVTAALEARRATK